MLTRKELEAMGLSKEQVDQIHDAHSTDIGVLKDQLTTAQNEASGFKEELETLRASSGDTVTLQTQISELQVQHATQTQEYQAQLTTALLESQMLKSGVIAEKVSRAGRLIDRAKCAGEDNTFSLEKAADEIKAVLTEFPELVAKQSGSVGLDMNGSHAGGEPTLHDAIATKLNQS